ncbi:hypothetical protein BJ508DRAFT_315799 [Ascobolus immersus RN42]|uniref:Uncharacterized protein n=1 Tax=Ascobolus immersus RN42 TaxID=1160509 RepID=A0A3N4HGN3_ASCIM|nr:hypothetical protein BJ508DRAFT_315799 [Ascobolus immersus RN42]
MDGTTSAAKYPNNPDGKDQHAHLLRQHKRVCRKRDEVPTENIERNNMEVEEPRSDSHAALGFSQSTARLELVNQDERLGFYTSHYQPARNGCKAVDMNNLENITVQCNTLKNMITQTISNLRKMETDVEWINKTCIELIDRLK